MTSPPFTGVLTECHSVSGGQQGGRHGGRHGGGHGGRHGGGQGGRQKWHQNDYYHLFVCIPKSFIFLDF